MYFLPISLALFLLFILLIPLLIVLAPAIAFTKLGLDPVCGYAFFILCLLGSGINIPIHRKKVDYAVPVDETNVMVQSFFGIKIPPYTEQVIAVNFGGAVLPVILSIYLLGNVPIHLVLIATAVTSTASYLLSKPVRGVGVIMPAFVPPLIAALTALAISREYAPPIAYISGVLGTLIGADILRLHQIGRIETRFLSIGGAGVFDGIYLVGLVSVLLA
ncbi:MAG TPA: DUF1614 domain-containing protein [Nitrospirae bacterium]|nr:hypothetical protein BMS3Abin08_01497 [bacterium BMS3Abin08]HDO36646.1 DUF1614 domain-containing protein [Nitrospirota bacterium]